jgi:putative hemolysin
MHEVNIIYYVVFFVCLLLASFFCSAETAFMSMQRLRLQHLVRTGRASAKIAFHIMQNPEKFLATVLFGINLFETAVATIGAIIAVNYWGENLGAILATIIVTILTLIVAELVPKSLAVRYADKFVLFYARPIQFISYVFYPFVFLLSLIGIRLTKLTSDDSMKKPTMSEDEFHTAIDIGEEEGIVEGKAAEMLHNVFDFHDQLVREVMIPRPDVVFIEIGTKLGSFLNTYASTPLSRYPVFKGNRDNVLGIITIKDILVALAKQQVTRDDLIDRFLKTVHFTPETKHIAELLREMRDKNFHMAVVVDEFGGTAGVVTIDQMVEEIVGPISDDFPGGEKDFEVIDAHTYEIDGSMRIDEANEEMGLHLPEGDYETVAGFILYLLRRIPKENEQLRYKDYKLVIKEMQGVKIERILLTKESHATP